MRKLAVAAAFCCGCSWIFMERVPEDHQRGQRVDCSGSKGWAAWDGVLAAAHGVGFIATAVVAKDLPGDVPPVFYVVAVSDLVLGVAHVGSALAGSKYADECLDARRESPNVIVTGPAVTPPAEPDRKTVWGENPLHCATLSLDVGECWLDEETCKQGLTASGAPACEIKKAGSCFNATKTLDGTKVTVCAVSIKDCEARRERMSGDPDWALTRCGIYRSR